MKKPVLMVTVILAFTVLVGCGNKASQLAGNWLLEDGQNYLGIVEYYKLNKDGSGIADINQEISWKVENSRFLLTFLSNSTVYDLEYELSGKTLIINVDGTDYRYKKSVVDDNGYRNWRSMIKTDPITDSSDIYFRVMSSTNNNKYLTIRRQNGKIEMYIDWNVDIDASDPNVTLRIDDTQPETIRANRGSNGKSTFYRDDPLPIIKLLFDAKQVVARYINSKNHTYTEIFDVSGFKDIVAKYNDDLKWLNVGDDDSKN